MDWLCWSTCQCVSGSYVIIYTPCWKYFCFCSDLASWKTREWYKRYGENCGNRRETSSKENSSAVLLELCCFTAIREEHWNRKFILKKVDKSFLEKKSKRRRKERYSEKKEGLTGGSCYHSLFFQGEEWINALLPGLVWSGLGWYDGVW